MEAAMDDQLTEWAERLSAIQEQLGGIHGQLEELRSELKAAGRKTDAVAFNDPIERLARYGRLFSDIHLSWTEPQD
jgi:hypothetical protein